MSVAKRLRAGDDALTALEKIRFGKMPKPVRWKRALPDLFEQLPQILKHGVFFVRARAVGEKELLAQVQCFSLHCSGIKPAPYRSQELSQREFSPVGEARRLRVEIIDRTPFAMSDGGTLLAPWCERLRIMSLFELAPEQIANVQLIRDLAPVSLS